MNLLSPSLNGVMTGLLLLMFVGIWLWSWSSKRKPDFEKMANLPLEDDIPAMPAAEKAIREDKDKEAL